MNFGKKMNLEFLKANAVLFKKSAERCLKRKNLPNKKFEILFIPGIVNCAFSIELYLKYLLIKNNKPYWGHELLKLFDLLDSAIKQEIIRLTKYSDAEFRALFLKHSNGFVEWRYIEDIL